MAEWEWDQEKEKEGYEFAPSEGEEYPGGWAQPEYNMEIPRGGGSRSEPEPDLFRSLLRGSAPSAQQPTIGGGSFEELFGSGGGGEGGYGSPDVDELRAEPWSTEFEQAAISRADELSSQKYNSLRQQRADEMARQGIGPDSPFWQSEMRKIDAEQAGDSSKFRRQLQLEKVDKRQSNLREARSVELMMDMLERQRIMDMLGLSGGGLDPNLAAILGGQASEAGRAAGEASGGLGELIAALIGTYRQPIRL